MNWVKAPELLRWQPFKFQNKCMKNIKSGKYLSTKSWKEIECCRDIYRTWDWSSRVALSHLLLWRPIDCFSHSTPTFFVIHCCWHNNLQKIGFWKMWTPLKIMMERQLLTVSSFLEEFVFYQRTKITPADLKWSSRSEVKTCVSNAISVLGNCGF